MMAPSSRLLFKRQDCAFGGCTSGSDSVDNNDSNFWWSNDGYYVRYAVIAAVIVVAILIMLFGYFHAQRRIKRGLEPLPYHRWLVRRSNRGQTYNPYPPQGTYAYYQQPGQTYPMNASMPPHTQQQPPQPGWAPPPPAYGQHQWDSPPTYAPPPGASKANADQNVSELPREHGEGSSTVSLPPAAHQAPRNDHIITQ